MLLGIGKVPGLIAVCIYAIPPIVRLTNLGIRQVNFKLIEAGKALGVSKFVILYKIEFPLALPSIMTGVIRAWMACYFYIDRIAYFCEFFLCYQKQLKCLLG